MFRENYNMKIKRVKNDTCPICRKPIKGDNTWVRYHIRYEPELVILACKYCNFVEYSLRNNIPIPPQAINMHRINKVIALHSRFGVQL